MDSKKFTSRPPSTCNKHDEASVIWLNNRQIIMAIFQFSCRHWQLSMEHLESTLHTSPIIRIILHFLNSRSKLLPLNTSLWQIELAVETLVKKFSLFNRNIIPTGVPNIIFQDTNDIIIHHSPIKPITPNEIIITIEMFVNFLSQCFTNSFFVNFIFHEVPVKTINMIFKYSRTIGLIGFTSCLFIDMKKNLTASCTTCLPIFSFVVSQE